MEFRRACHTFVVTCIFPDVWVDLLMMASTDEWSLPKVCLMCLAPCTPQSYKYVSPQSQGSGTIGGRTLGDLSHRACSVCGNPEQATRPEGFHHASLAILRTTRHLSQPLSPQRDFASGSWWLQFVVRVMGEWNDVRLRSVGKRSRRVCQCEIRRKWYSMHLGPTTIIRSRTKRAPPG
jgi:hypothetical protein